MKNYEVFIIVAVLGILAWHFYKGTQNLPPVAKVQIASGTCCNKNFWPCKQNPAIQNVISACGEIL